MQTVDATIFLVLVGMPVMHNYSFVIAKTSNLNELRNGRKKTNNYSNDGNFSFKTLPETFECIDHTHANWLMMAMNQFEYFYKKTLKINRFNVYGYKDTLFPYAWISGVCWLNHASEWQTMHFEDKRKWCQNFIFIDCNFTIIRKRRQKKTRQQKQ